MRHEIHRQILVPQTQRTIRWKFRSFWAVNGYQAGSSLRPNRSTMIGCE
jgi:hypothetical protein